MSREDSRREPGAALAQPRDVKGSQKSVRSACYTATHRSLIAAPLQLRSFAGEVCSKYYFSEMRLRFWVSPIYLFTSSLLSLILPAVGFYNGYWLTWQSSDLTPANIPKYIAAVIGIFFFLLPIFNFIPFYFFLTKPKPRLKTLGYIGIPLNIIAFSQPAVIFFQSGPEWFK